MILEIIRTFPRDQNFSVTTILFHGTFDISLENNFIIQSSLHSESSLNRYL